MTYSDNAADQILTEDAPRPRQSEGDCIACYKQFGKRGRCAFSCDAPKYGLPFSHTCSCWECIHKALHYKMTRDPEYHNDHRIRFEEKRARYIRHAEISRKIDEASRKKELHEQNKQNAKSELGPREFTLTYSPKTHFETDADAQKAMSLAIERLTRYYQHEIKYFHAVGEYTEAGNSHIHGYYLLEGGKKITDKNFKRAYPPWNPKRKLKNGFEGGHHATLKRVADFSGYIEKNLNDAWINIHINHGDDD